MLRPLETLKQQPDQASTVGPAQGATGEELGKALQPLVDPPSPAAAGGATRGAEAPRRTLVPPDLLEGVSFT